MQAEPQYGCYTFTFHQNAPSPIPASKNMWLGDWASYWFYHKVPMHPTMKHHPLVVRTIGNLGKMPKVDVERVAVNEGYLSILWEVSKLLGVHDITEEFAAYGCFPVREGWTVLSWVSEEKRAFGLQTPDIAKAFQLCKEGKY